MLRAPRSCPVLDQPIGTVQLLLGLSGAAVDMNVRRKASTEETEMAVLEDLAAERQRLTARLARIDAERQKLAEQIAELDAAERVLSRMTQGGTGARRGRRAQTGEAAAAAPTGAPGRRGRRAK